MNTSFEDEMKKAYTCTGDYISLGAALLDDHCYPKAPITLPLKMMNRHGLISGATGTGKTVTIQNIAGELSAKGIPVLLMDIKGDLSGIAKPGLSNPKILERQKKIGTPFDPKGYPVEFFSLSQLEGVKLRTTVSQFGPLLLSKILELNDIQSGLVALIFKYCEDNKLPLIDLKDLKKTLLYLSDRADLVKEWGQLSKTSIAAIMRKIAELEQQGADPLFGEPSFEVNDFIQFDEKGQGYISIVSLNDIQDKPKLFSTFMLSLLAQIYSTFPEVGDLPKPKLVLFFDEAHLIFDQASQALLNQIETIVRLIRSKGVGIFFCTQTPRDVPSSVLGQLGLKIQHALRAFTALDRKNIKLTAENFPLSDYYKTNQLLTELGIGEALVTSLNEKGVPTPLVATLLDAPSSFIGPLTSEECKALIQKSHLVKKYEKSIESISANEILTEKAEKEESQGKFKRELWKMQKILGTSTIRQVFRTIARELTRAVLSLLGMGKK